MNPDRSEPAGDRGRGPPHALPFHYGWVIVVAGMLTVLGSLGIGRFSLGMLLPSMGRDLGLSYTQMGLISTGNFVGYLVAVLGCGWFVRRRGARSVVCVALVTVGSTLVLIAASRSFVTVLLLYVLTGIGSGAANVPMMGLVSHWFGKRRRGRAAGFMVIGSGFAIMGSGLLIPMINAHWGAPGWRYGWLVLGLVVLVIALVCGLVLRNDPREFGLRPLGDGTADDTANAPEDMTSGAHRGVLAHLATVYFLFGFTYVIYATFIVTTLVQEHGYREADAGRLWFWIGLLSLASGPVFGWLSDHAGRRAGLATVFAFHATAYLLAGLELQPPYLFASIALFGLAAWSVPGIMAAAVGDYLGPARAVNAFGTITFAFGVGQIAGPALAGLLAEREGGFATSYLLAAGLASGALLLSLLLRSPADQRPPSDGHPGC